MEYFCTFAIDFFYEKSYNGIAMKKYVHKREFQVKYCEADFKDELKLAVVLSYMEEVACSSADELGFGYAYIKPKGYAFVLSNLYIECMRPIRLGETVHIHTHPSIPTYATFGREYEFLDGKGASTVKASSRWCLLDIQTGKILPSKVIDNQDYATYNTDKVVENPVWKIPTFEVDGEPAFSLIVANGEYDHNMHVNNTRYAEYCLNCFSVAELSPRFVSRFAIAYKKQCKEGETLRFYRKEILPSEYVVMGVNGNGETVVQAQIQFTEQGEVPCEKTPSIDN